MFYVLSNVMGLMLEQIVISFPCSYVLIKHFSIHISPEMLDSCGVLIIFTIIDVGCFLLLPN